MVQPQQTEVFALTPPYGGTRIIGITQQYMLPVVRMAYNCQQVY